MKKIVIINSTYRKGGNSEILADEFAKGAKEKGHNVNILNLRELHFDFCHGCLACLRMGKCVMKDDINGLLDTIKEADVLVFATPVYYYSMCGQLKTFLDRLNPLYGQDNKFREVYLLATCAENDKSAVDGTIHGIQGWVDCFEGVELKGIIYGIGVDNVGAVKNTNAVKEAYTLGKSL